MEASIYGSSIIDSSILTTHFVQFWYGLEENSRR